MDSVVLDYQYVTAAIGGGRAEKWPSEVFSRVEILGLAHTATELVMAKVQGAATALSQWGTVVKSRTTERADPCPWLPNFRGGRLFRDRR